MKSIAVLSGDKRQHFINEYLTKENFDSKLKNNLDFNGYDYIVCSTPFSRDGLYLNCDFYSSFPVETFIDLIKPNQTVFAGSVSNAIKKIFDMKNVEIIDILQDEKVLWENAKCTAEGLIGDIILNTDFTLDNSKILIIGFGRCGINTALRLKSFNSQVTIYDHTYVHLCEALSYGFNISMYDQLKDYLGDFDIIINTVSGLVLNNNLMSYINPQCILFDISSKPYGIDAELAKKHHLSLFTCPGLPGITAPKTAGELIAKNIISYLERTKRNGS